MNAKHTPGPWFVKYETHIYAADGYETACADYAGNQHCEMDDNGLEVDRGMEEAKANARLIAAAPELLALLAQALNFIEHREANLGKLTTDEEWDANVAEYRKRGISGVGIGRSYTDKAFVNLDAIRAAIAKATGA